MYSDELYKQFADIEEINYRQWLKAFAEIMKENEGNTLLTDEMMAEMVKIDENQEEEGYYRSISDLIEGMDDAWLICEILTISPTKHIESRDGKEYFMRKMLLRDDTGEIWVNIWGPDEQKVSHMLEEETLHGYGDLIDIKGLSIQTGYNDEIEATWTETTKVEVLANKGMGFEVTESFKDLKAEQTYHLLGRVVFKGMPVMVGMNKTRLSKLTLVDDNGYEITINAWRNSSEPFFNLDVGKEIIITVDTSYYNEDLQYTFEDNWGIVESSKDPEPVGTRYATKRDIDSVNGEEILNVEGIITRVYAPHPYDRGEVCKYDVGIDEDETVPLTLFGYLGESLKINVGDHIAIYHAMIDYDSYNERNQITANSDTSINVNDWGKITGVPPSTFPPVDISLRELHADTGEYIDISALVLRKGVPMTYQRSDESTGTRCKCTIADRTGISPMVIWGDNHFNVEHTKTYEFYNVTVRENTDLLEYEINVDSNTRIVETDLDKYEIYHNNFPLVEEFDETMEYDYVSIEGMIDVDAYQLTVYDKCPKCNGRVTDTLSGLFCSTCEEEVEKAYKLYKLDTFIGDSAVVIWGDLVKHLWKDHIERNVPLSEQSDDLMKEIKGNKYLMYGQVNLDRNTQMYCLTVLNLTKVDE